MIGGAELSGFADVHLHQFADLAFGGRVIWGQAFGMVEENLPSCRRVHGWRGMSDWIGNGSRVVLLGAPLSSILGHRTQGYPSFRGWPRWDDFTHQAVHETSLKRAVDGGLRLIVMVAVNNDLLCRLSRRGGDTSCDDMVSVDLQLQAAKDMEAYVDAACGGPGEGWYRIVYSPAQAREVIGSGKLAVVLGVEVDNIFGGHRDADITATALTAAVEHCYAVGVRHVIPFHFCDNAFGGAAFALPLQWSNQGGILSRSNPPLSLPIYRMNTTRRDQDGYHYRRGRCNTQGLTHLGRQLLTRLMAKGMVVDVDHMSARTRADVLDVTGEADYPVVAGHAEFLEISRPRLRSERQLRGTELARICGGGGFVAPLLRQANVEMPRMERGTLDSFIRAYRHLLQMTDGAAVGLGTDFNGFAGLPRPRSRSSIRSRKRLGERRMLDYPFPSPLSGKPVERSVLGERSFDINQDGLAHVGMMPDFLADLRVAGLSDREIRPLMHSALGYVQMWEKAVAAR